MGTIPYWETAPIETIRVAMDFNAKIWANNETGDVVMRILLALAGSSVAWFWLGLGVVPMIDLWGSPFINLGNIEWLTFIGGLVLAVWTAKGVIKATVIRYMPPAIVALPIGDRSVRNRFLCGEVLTSVLGVWLFNNAGAHELSPERAQPDVRSRRWASTSRSTA